MRYLFFIAIISRLLFAMDATQAAQRIQAETHYSIAIKKATEEKKIVVMVMVKEHCRWCQKLIKHTLLTPAVQARLKDFITLIVDKEGDYPTRFKADFFPSIVFIDYHTQKSIYEQIGYINSIHFLEELQEIEQTYHSLYEAPKK